MPIFLIFESMDKVLPGEDNYISQIIIQLQAHQLHKEIGEHTKFLPTLNGEEFILGNNYKAKVTDIDVSTITIKITNQNGCGYSFRFEPDVIKEKYDLLVEKMGELLKDIAKTEYLNKKLQILKEVTLEVKL